MNWFKFMSFETVVTDGGNELIRVYVSDGIHYQNMYITNELIEDSMFNAWKYIREQFEEGVNILEKGKENG